MELLIDSNSAINEDDISACLKQILTLKNSPVAGRIYSFKDKKIDTFMFYRLSLNRPSIEGWIDKRHQKKEGLFSLKDVEVFKKKKNKLIIIIGDRTPYIHKADVDIQFKLKKGVWTKIVDNTNKEVFDLFGDKEKTT